MNTTIKKTLADTIQEEARDLSARASDGRSFVYVNKPYSCGIPESLSHFRPFEYLEFPAGAAGPLEILKSKDGRATIERGQEYTVITLQPLKGSRKRRPYIIRLWV